MMLDYAQEYEFDYILVDFGPSSGAINKVFVMSCDYILPPVFGEKYSIDALEVFFYKLFPNWIVWATNLRSSQAVTLDFFGPNRNDLNPYLFNMRNPKILPIIFSSFKIKRETTTQPPIQLAPSYWLEEIEKILQNINIPEAVKDLLIDNGKVIPIIRNLGAAITVSQKKSIPLPLLDDLNGENNRSWIEDRKEEVINNFTIFLTSLDTLPDQ